MVPCRKRCIFIKVLLWTFSCNSNLDSELFPLFESWYFVWSQNLVDWNSTIYSIRWKIETNAMVRGVELEQDDLLLIFYFFSVMIPLHEIIAELFQLIFHWFFLLGFMEQLCDGMIFNHDPPRCVECLVNSSHQD